MQNRNITHNQQNRHVLSTNVHLSDGMTIVNSQEYFDFKKEYSDLKKENFDLKAQILQLLNNERQLKEIIDSKEQTIEELKKENAELKIRLNTLEKEHNELRQEHVELKQNFNTLSNNFNKMMTKKLVDKYIVAIQDLNRIEDLEKKLDKNGRQALQQLRRARINDCHYLDNNFLDEHNDRRMVLEEKISNMPVDVQHFFSRKYPNLLHALKPFIVSTRTVPAQCVLDDINDWWDG